MTETPENPAAENPATVREWVQAYYGRVLAKSEDLQTNACCAGGVPPGWLAQRLANVHEDVLARFYGCGFPIPEALEGATVLDLGCGTGRDVYVLSQLVGSEGFVHGVDMTEAQLQVARRTQGWHMERFGFSTANVAFHQGFIEDLSFIESGSIDVVVSNCVVNLSPRKDLVLAEARRVLRPGGSFYLSDVLVDRRLPEAIASDPLLHSECLGGAMYDFDFLTLAKASGFPDPRICASTPITIQNEQIERRVGAARFSSVTLRMLALQGLDLRCEDYGQVATYRGTMPHVGALFRLDEHHLFEAGRPERICGNTAAMLTQTRFASHFQVAGDRSVHYGVFDCEETVAGRAEEVAPGPGRCC